MNRKLLESFREIYKNPKNLNKEEITVNCYIEIINFLRFLEEEIKSRILVTSDAHDEICLYTREQLQLFINYFYATRGYIFKNQNLREYFKGMYFDILNEPCVYTPDENFTEQKLNVVEKENISFLTNLKNKLYK